MDMLFSEQAEKKEEVSDDTVGPILSLIHI